MKFVPFVFFAVASAFAAPTPPQAYAAPRFLDSDRETKIRALLPEVDRAFTDFAAQRHVPGVVWAVVLDGRLVHTGATGFANIEKKIPAAADTRFRIASMTKSFTAMAILKLRDAGKLSLYDAVDKFLPDFRNIAPLTSDAPSITVRHLLTMTAGFPEDNPWGDRQLSRSAEELQAFMRGGMSLSNAPGIGYEYSNLGFALLGQIIARVAGMPYQRYITREILEPLGMRDTVWEFSDVPAEKLALGYRWEDNTWKLEPMLHDGTYGAMGGLLTTLPDFARYVSFHLAAWPARNDPEAGPVRRATLREMHKPAEVTGLITDQKNLVGDIAPVVNGYGYGLRWSVDARGIVNVGHSGGLPGFGSNYRFYPDYGVAVIAFANLTYAGPAGANGKAGSLLIEKAGLPRQTQQPSTILEERKQQIVELVKSWDATLADTLVAENFFLDRSREDWVKRSRDTLAQVGKISSVGPIMPENQLRGTFSLIGENGRVEVFFTLTPERAARLQQLRLTFVKQP